MFKVIQFGCKNFMSFKEVSIYPQNKCYAIRGENKDNEGQVSNGGGKTSLVDIIPVTLLGTSLTGRNLKDCVNWDGANSFTTQVILENSVHGLNVLVQRTVFNNSKSAELVILVNGEVPKSIPTKAGVENGVDVKAGNDYIINEILCISKEDLLNYYFISLNHYTPFLRYSVDKKTEIISRFSNSSVVDYLIDQLKISLKSSEKAKVSLDAKISSIEGYLSALKDSMSANLKDQFEVERKAAIERIQADKSTIEERLVNLDAEAEDLGQKLAGFEIKSVNIDEKKELSEIRSTLESELKENKIKKIKVEREITHIENHLAGLIECPNCSHTFSLSTDSYSKKDLIKQQKLLNDINATIKECEENINLLINELQSFIDIEQENKRILSEQNNIKRSIDTIVGQQERLLKDYEALENKLAEETSKKFSDQTSSVKSKIKDKELELKDVQGQLKALLKEMSQMEIWIDRYGEFKFYLANKPIDMISSLINDLLSKVGSDLNIQIEGFKRLKSGQIKADLNAMVYRNWQNPQPYVQFSEGERARLNLAIDLTFQSLINSSSKHGGLDFYVSDELLNSLDSLGIQKAAEAFNSLGKNILLVAHSGADLTYENTIVVEKKNWSSKIKAG